MFTLRKLRLGETDHEVIWPLVSAGCGVTAFAWLHLHLPIPRCGFHLATGLPCVACGATRCIQALIRGSWSEAFGYNPMVFVTIAALLAFDVYAVMILGLKRPRLRLQRPMMFSPRMVRVSVVAVLALNWAYLIHRGDI